MALLNCRIVATVLFELSRDLQKIGFGYEPLCTGLDT